MARSSGLQQSISQDQRLQLTPQLFQAITMLQMNQMELTSEVARLLEENVFVEEAESCEVVKADDVVTPEVTEVPETVAAPASDEPDGNDTEVSARDGAASEDEYRTLTTSTSSYSDDSEPYVNRAADEVSISEHLLRQVSLIFGENEKHLLIAKAIVYSLDDQGLLPLDNRRIVELVSDQIKTTEAEVEDVILRVQDCEPTGVAARSIEEMLHLQLLDQGIDPDNEALKDAMALIEGASGKDIRDIADVARRQRWDDARFQAAASLLHRCNPHPLDAYRTNDVGYIEPEVIVRKIEGRWTAFLNGETLPRVRFNSEYAELMKGIGESDSAEFLKQSVNEAKWFFSALENRGKTVLLVAREICQYQQEYFDKGDIAIKPMILADLAQRLGLHESTISRSTAGKYIQGPRGVIEMKHFFSRGLPGRDNKAQSSWAIKERIKTLIGNESPVKPLSDTDIVNMLERQGIAIARRTVAKYRDALNIPSLSERRARR